MKKDSTSPIKPVCKDKKYKETPLMLVSEISRMFKERMRTEAEGIPDTYRPIIIELSIFKKLTQIDIAKKVHLRAPTVCVTLQKMEADGYIQRETDEDDLRKIWISLTKKGRLYNENVLKRLRSVDDEVMKNISEDEERLLCELLRKVRNNMYENLKEHQNEL